MDLKRCQGMLSPLSSLDMLRTGQSNHCKWQMAAPEAGSPAWPDVHAAMGAAPLQGPERLARPHWRSVVPAAVVGPQARVPPG